MRLLTNDEWLTQTQILHRCGALPWNKLWRRGEFLLLILIAPFAGIIWFVMVIGPLLAIPILLFDLKQLITPPLLLTTIVVMEVLFLVIIGRILWQATSCCLLLTRDSLLLRGIRRSWGFEWLLIVEIPRSELRELFIVVHQHRTEGIEHHWPEPEARKPVQVTFDLVGNGILVESDSGKKIRLAYLREVFDQQEFLEFINGLCEEGLIVRPKIHQPPDHFATFKKIAAAIGNKLRGH